MNYRNQAKVAVPALAFGLGIAGIAGEVFEFHETTSETSSYRSCSQQESGSGGPSCLSEGAHWYSYSTSSSWSPSGETEPAQGNEWCPGLGRRGSPPPGLCGDQPVYTVTSTSVSGECVLVYRDDCYGSVPTCPTGECGSGGGNGSGGGGIPNVTPESSGLYGTGGTGDPFGEDQCEINASNCSVRLAFSLGRSARGRKIGHLLVSQPEPGPALSSPACLELVGQDLEGTAVLRNPDYSIRQILTHDQLIDVAVVGEGSWRVAFHPRPAELLRDADGWILPGGEPRRTATVSRAGEGDVAFVDRTGSRERHYRFLWKGGKTGWALSVEGTGSYVLSRRTESPDGQTHERVKEHYSLDDRLLKRERWVYRQFPFGDLPVRYEVGDGTALRWHEIEYYEDPTDRASYGHAKASTESDGTWKRFVYSADGLSSTSIGPWKDSAPTFRPEEGRAVEVSYRFLRPGEEFYYPGAMVEQRTESILGVPVGRSFALRGHLPTGERLEVIERSASPGGRFGVDAGQVRAGEHRYHPRREADPGSDQLAAIVRADGTATRYLYESGHYDGEGGVPGEFEPAAGGPFLRVTETTVPAALPGGIAGRTLSTRAVYTADQRQVLSETSVLAAAGETPRWERLSWTTTLYDGRNRVASRRDATGILSEYRYNDCCGKLEWERDADGSVVSHVHDAL
ncbi:MAG TPA: hypothetical protein PLA50_08805, partial [Bacteroidia bacterium]|nr:hypothetical protein [Bacteroidia bacterium]